MQFIQQVFPITRGDKKLRLFHFVSLDRVVTISKV
jgi:hypothetical protein